MPSLDIADLLIFCADDISRRQADLIRTEESLLSILEKRDLIDKNELEKMRPLTTLKVKQAIDRYKPPTENLVNVYAIQREKDEEARKLYLARTQTKSTEISFYQTGSNVTSQSIQPQKSQNVNVKIIPTLFEERKAWIYKEISLEIGKMWRCFGRGINIREGEMDNLEIECKSIGERVYKMLHMLEKNEFNNMERVYYKIIKSLEENCNRRKLSDKIKKSMIR
ncbi:fas-associated death domain protein-like isoform X2 [Condylostylus longicornis]|uniref:fas-associated death domain protein-like isoform X2 n=1 Tax=Condylostylus longicornis TaxID=2530218 RepID=UPI00244E3801|nr:fas-associated death domain protein-like isoform X2 [Condylostylus longicornis]